MAQLIGLIKPLLHIMTAAVLLGTAGYLCASFLTITASRLLCEGLLSDPKMGQYPWKQMFAVMAVLAVMRGILHYAEQYCNHYIAFKLLAIIRHKVFAALRRLCPAKLEGEEKGNLISIITTDIELLEVFYAHTISPIAIAVLTSAIMTIYIGSYHWLSAILAAAGYILIGVVVPLINGAKGRQKGMAYRTQFGALNSYVLDSLRGLDEILQYHAGKDRLAGMQERSGQLAQEQRKLSHLEGMQRAVTNFAILLCSFGMLALNLVLFYRGQMQIDGVIVCTTAMMVSFGPVAALSGLSNNLNQTLASGERVLSILEEEPQVEEIPEPTFVQDNVPDADMDMGGSHDNSAQGKALAQSRNPASNAAFCGAELNNVTFSYKEQKILEDYSLRIKSGQITGLHGPSGCGKSTVMKLLLRFWDTKQGDVLVNGRNVRETPTAQLRRQEGYMTQTTHLFHDSIAANIAVGKPDATQQEIEAAAKKASIHDFIMGLPEGYETEVGELGDTLSGGEKQRIGIARAFLHDAPFLLMDEPTSNLDALNEGIILKSLQEEAKDKTVLLVSHRDSTMAVASEVYEMRKNALAAD